MTTIAVFGLGEAGALIAGDLARAGLVVKGYDPASVETPTDVARCAEPAAAVEDANVVIALTQSADADEALAQAYDAIPSTALYADFSTSSAALERGLAARAAERNIDFADVALLGIVPGNGVRTPALASGTGADRFVKTFSPLGMPVQSIGATAGDAASRKLLRSVFMKGLAGVLIEAMRAAEQAGQADWLWEHMLEEIANADASWARRLVAGTGPHALRRLHEMEAAESLLEELGVEPTMTRSTVAGLRQVLASGLPDIPQSVPAETTLKSVCNE